jgi:hypothetical protein
LSWGRNRVNGSEKKKNAEQSLFFTSYH